MASQSQALSGNMLFHSSESVHFEYDECIETRVKLPMRRIKKKLSKREFLKTKEPVSKKLAFVPKRSKINKLKARDTKSWHRGEYTRTNPDSHNDECECQGCGEHNDMMGGWLNRDDDEEWDWCDYLSDVSYEEEYDGPDRCQLDDDEYARRMLWEVDD